MTGDSFWCRACRARTDDLDDRGNPRDWYKLTLNRPDPPGESDVRPGWYCSPACLVSMLALGVEETAAVAWLRGDG